MHSPMINAVWCLILRMLCIVVCGAVRSAKSIQMEGKLSFSRWAGRQVGRDAVRKVHLFSNFPMYCTIRSFRIIYICGI